MGCSSSSAAGGTRQGASPSSVNVSSLKEEQIKQAFKAKRGNVFTASIAPEVRRTFVAKVHPKTSEQVKIIRSAFQQNFAFESLLEDLDVPLSVIIDAMSLVPASQGQEIVTQGDVGDYFYVIEKGTYTVLVDKKPVAVIGDGQQVKSFGELSLIYDVPRQATVRADSEGSLFRLDRDTYRFTIANSYEKRNHEIGDSLQRVPLLKNLTPAQMAKLIETVELTTYGEGDEIIRKGTEGNVFYIVKEGSVKVDDVGEKFQSHTLGPGDYFGERALMTNEPRAATVTALRKTVLMTLDKIAFQKHLGPLQDVLDSNLNMRVLNSVKLFEKLTPNERTRLCKSFVTETFPASSTIIKQGDRGTKFYILVDGKADVFDKGNLIGGLKSGDYFGEMALLDDDTRKATIIATVDCKCAYVDRATFTKILGSLKHLMERETLARLEALERASNNDYTPRGPEENNQPPPPKLPQKEYELHNLVHIAMLGSGTFGRVTLVQDKPSKMLFALKAMYKSEIVAHKQQTNVMNEKMVLQTCSHPFILKLFQTFRDSKRLYMLLGVFYIYLLCTYTRSVFFLTQIFIVLH